jgi:hypothetical protein
MPCPYKQQYFWVCTIILVLTRALQQAPALLSSLRTRLIKRGLFHIAIVLYAWHTLSYLQDK